MKKVIFLPICFVVACSSDQSDDPYEQFNRASLDLNVTLEQNVLAPAASIYKEITLHPMQRSLANFFVNWKEPYFFINYAIISDAERMSNSLFRFLINSSIGILGLFDVAEQIGLQKEKISYKDTLKSIGMPSGNYVVLPVLGFSSERDAIAEPISWLVDPVGYFIGWPYMLAKMVFSEINDAAENYEMRTSTIQNSIDLYSATKSIYSQKYAVKSDLYNNTKTPASSDGIDWQ